MAANMWNILPTSAVSKELSVVKPENDLKNRHHVHFEPSRPRIVLPCLNKHLVIQNVIIHFMTISQLQREIFKFSDIVGQFKVNLSVFLKKCF